MAFEGFTEFVAARGQALFRMALALTGDRAAAEDLVQEALTRTARRWRRVIRDGDPERYVRAVMLNEVRSQWRRPRRRDVSMAQPPDSTSGGDHQAGTVNKLALADVLRQLSPRQRAVIFLRYYEDRSVDETAHLLSCSPGTVKRQTHDALVRMRALAPELLPDGEAQELG